jgi:hypothetical protein
MMPGSRGFETGGLFKPSGFLLAAAGKKRPWSQVAALRFGVYFSSHGIDWK